jgi:TRAP-type C4-dicarboxylate transport system permease small subunit
MKRPDRTPAMPPPTTFERALARLDRGLTIGVTSLLVCAFAIMLGLAVLQLLLRGTLHYSISWGDIAARQLVIWVGFLGAYLATRGGKHFRIDVLSRLFPPRARAWITALSDLFAAVVCLFLVKAGVTFVTTGLDPKAVLFLGIPQTAAALIVPAGFALIALQLLLRMIESAAKAVRGLPPQGTD